MTSDAYSLDKAADAAFFEDWSEWQCLDGLPETPRPYNRYLHAAGGPYSSYYCILDKRSRTFEIKVPPQAPITRLVTSLPGVLQDKRAGPGWTQVAHSRKQWVYWVPAQHYKALLAALPIIKRLTSDFVRSHSIYP